MDPAILISDLQFWIDYCLTLVSGEKYYPAKSDETYKKLMREQKELCEYGD